MIPEITCMIIENDKILRTMTQITDFQHLSDSIDRFQVKLNDAINKILNDAPDLSGDDDNEDENEDSEGDEEQVTPKKKKKN